MSLKYLRGCCRMCFLFTVNETQGKGQTITKRHLAETYGKMLE